jgi:tetratricopeptide (TPR) repeat protein
MRSRIITERFLSSIPLDLCSRRSLADLKYARRQKPLAKAILFLLLAVSSITPKSAICQSSEEQLEVFFRAGQEALRRGEFVRAAEQFKKALALDPTLVEAEVNLGLAYQSLFEYELAVRHLTKALHERPGLLGPTVIVGMDYLKLGSPQKALPFLHAALKLDPSNRDAHEALASSYLYEENFEDAAEEFRRIATLDPDKAEAWFKLGHQYLDLASRLAFRGAHLYRESAWGHRFLGDLLFQRSRWEDAAQEYRKGLAIDPQQSGLHSAAGQAYLRSGKREEAESELRGELQLDPRNEEAWLGLASLELTKGEATAALDCVAKVWEISPEFLAVQHDLPSIELAQDSERSLISSLGDAREGAAKHFLLAALYATSNQTALFDREWETFQAAFVAWQQAMANTLGAQPEQSSCKGHHYSRCVVSLQAKTRLTTSEHLLLGKTHFTLQEYELAANALGKVPGITRENAEASYWLERTYQALGAQAYSQLQESFPDSWRTHQLRAESFALHPNFDAAVKEYQTALQLRPNEPELHEALGQLYIENQNDEGQSELENALALDASRTHALYLLGRLCVQKRENEKAVSYLQRALRLQPDLAEASGLLGTAYVRLGQFANAIPRLEKAATLDHYGNVHYQLYLAYRKLGQNVLAQKALLRSQNLRRSSLEHDQAVILGSPQPESEP